MSRRKKKIEKSNWQPGVFDFVFKHGYFIPWSEVLTSCMDMADAMALFAVMGQLKLHHSFHIKNGYIWLSHKEQQARSGASNHYQRKGIKNLCRLGIIKKKGYRKSGEQELFVNDNGGWILTWILYRYHNDMDREYDGLHLGQFQKYGRELYKTIRDDRKPRQFFRKFIKEMESCSRKDLKSGVYDDKLIEFYNELRKHCDV